MTRLIFTTIFSFFALTSCFREDVLLPPYQSDPTVRQETIPLAEEDPIAGVVFKNQVFFNLEKGLTWTVKRDSWDLAFETSPKGFHVTLNSANYMQATNAGSVAFGTLWSEEDLTGFEFDFDASSGNLDSTVIGEWLDRESGLSHKDVFLINRGFNGSLEERGYLKLQFQSLKNDTISFIYSDLNGENERKGEVYVGDQTSNFVYFSFESNDLVTVEPPKEEWDLVFTYYSYRYPDGIPYWLTGALTNRHKVRSAEVSDNSMAFENISLADTSRFPFTRNIDEIGFDWKEYLFGPPARYVVYSDRIFIVQDTRGIYYKLRFLDFYNTEGQRGFPTFEFAEL